MSKQSVKMGCIARIIHSCFRMALILLAFIVGIILIFLFCGVIPNNLRMYTFSRRLTNTALPDKMHVIKEYRHIGTTIYNSNYCHFIVAELLESDLSKTDMAKALLQQKILGVNREMVPLKLAFYDKASKKLSSYNETDKKLIEDFIYPEFLKPDINLTKRNKEKNNYVLLFVEDMRMDFDGSGFDYRCM